MASSASTMMQRTPRIALVAGEVSGDFLGAGLMTALRDHYPNACFEGVGGEQMLAAGLDVWHPMHRLSVMGLVEVLRHLPSLLALRRELVARWIAAPPDVFIGIDAPDFNLGLARRLKRAGIPTVHYVSPTVWAWRQGRVRLIRRAVDRMLSIFPFETAFFEQHGVPVTFVGHPLADAIDLNAPTPDAAETLAVLPGSRLGEIEAMGAIFIDTARWLMARRPGLQVIIPCATSAIRHALEALLAERGDGDGGIRLVDGQARACLASARVALVASGTASLEAMLLKRPMVVAYRVSPITAWLARRLVKVPHIAMPNLIAGERLVPEHIQEQVTVERLGHDLLALLEDDERHQRLRDAFAAIHASLRLDASRRAADAVVEVLGASRRQLPATG